MDENDLIIVATFDYDWQAHMAQGLLAEQQIASTLDNEIFASLYPISGCSAAMLTVQKK